MSERKGQGSKCGIDLFFFRSHFGINKAPPHLGLSGGTASAMSLGDVVDAVSLAEKGLLSPQSFQKVVSRIVRGKDVDRSGAKVGLSLAP